MKAALDALGWIAPVIENKRTGYLVDGHERVMQALLTNALVPFAEVDLDETEEKLALATFDPIGAMAEYDRTLLNELLREVDTDEVALQEMLNNLGARVGVIPPDNPYDEWVGMPEFEQDNLEAPYSIRVNFSDIDALHRFGQLIEQSVTENTKSIWYPERPNRPHKGKEYVNE